MTLDEWRNEVLKVCKYCRRFVDGKNNRHQCDRFDSSIYDASRCKRTHSLRKQAKKISEAV